MEFNIYCEVFEDTADYIYNRGTISFYNNIEAAFKYIEDETVDADSVKKGTDIDGFTYISIEKGNVTKVVRFCF